MKKVAFVVGTSGFSGAESVNITIINNLRKKYNFYYCAPRGTIVDILKENNIDYFELKGINRKEIKRMVRTINPDIVHTQDFMPSFICAMVKEKYKMIMHVHINAPWLKKVCAKSIGLLYIGHKADKILTVSNAVEDEYVFSKYLNKKIINVYNPIDRKVIMNKLKNKANQKEYDICCVGRISEPKDPIRFVNIIEKLIEYKNDIRCVWVGEGDLRNKVETYVEQKKLSNNVKFVGFQKNPFKYMDQSKIFVLTSKYEGFGLVAFEALTLGLPCIVSSVGGLKEIVTDECGKLCENDDDFINEIKELMENEEKYKSKSKNAEIRSKEIENIDEYMKKIDDIYNE